MSAAAKEIEAPSPVSPRQAHGLFFRAILDFLRSRGHLEEVLSMVSEPTRRYIDRPPWAGRWIPSQPVDEIEEALQRIGGDELNVALGLFAAQQMVAKRIEPIVSAIFALMGRRPAALFRSLNLCFSLATRGISFVYVPEDERSGKVVAHFRGPGTPEAAWHALRGALLYGLDLAGALGEIGEPEPIATAPAGTTVRYAISWQ
jgi:hypothetical protein